MKKTKNNLLFIVATLFCVFLFLGACAEEETTQTGAQEEQQGDNLCGDGVCDSAEESSGFCSADCGGDGNTATTTETTTASATGIASSTTQVSQNGPWA